MSRELLILRHGKSDWPEGVEDFNRPLKNRGKRDTRKMGEWLLERKLSPDWIVSSPAMRASQTAENLGAGLKLKKDREVHFDARVYLAECSQLKKVLADCPSTAQRVLLIGHNPGLEDLLNDLAPGVQAREDGKLLPTSTLARLLLPDDWVNLPSLCGELLDLVRP